MKKMHCLKYLNYHMHSVYRNTQYGKYTLHILVWNVKIASKYTAARIILACVNSLHKYIFCLFFPRSPPDMSDPSKLKLIWHIKYIIPKRQWHIEISFFHQSICRICYKWKPIIKFIVGERERESGREEERRRERVWSKWSNFSISSLATTNDTVSTYDIKLHLNGSCWSLSSNAMKSILFKVNDAFILCFFLLSLVRVNFDL